VRRGAILFRNGGCPSLCIEKMHTTFFIKLFNKKAYIKENMEPPHNTYKPDNR
jgi:hypothetical protein